MNVRGEGDGHSLAERLAGALAADPRVGEVAVTGGNPLFIRRAPSRRRRPPHRHRPRRRFTFVSPEVLLDAADPDRARPRLQRRRGAASAPRGDRQQRATAHAFWPGADPIGQHDSGSSGRKAAPVDEIPGYTEVTVVGVVRRRRQRLAWSTGATPGTSTCPISSADPHARRCSSGRAASATSARTRSRRSSGGRVPDPAGLRGLPLAEMRRRRCIRSAPRRGSESLLGAIALGAQRRRASTACWRTR